MKKSKPDALAMRKFLYLQILACVFACFSCKSLPVSSTNTNSGGETGVLSDLRGVPDINNVSDPLLKARIEKIQAALKQTPPILKLEENLDENQKTAQEIALKDERFLREILDEKTREPLFNEIFGIYPLRESDMAGAGRSL